MFRSSTILREFVQNLDKVTLLLKHSVKLRHFIATGYGLDGPGIESRWWGRFSAPVQTGPGAHPACCTTGNVPFPGLRAARA